MIIQIRNYPERRAAYGLFPPLWRIFPKHTIKDTAQLVKKGLHNKVDGADGDGSLSGLWHFGGNDERVCLAIIPIFLMYRKRIVTPGEGLAQSIWDKSHREGYFEDCQS